MRTQTNLMICMFAIVSMKVAVDGRMKRFRVMIMRETGSPDTSGQMTVTNFSTSENTNASDLVNSKYSGPTGTVEEKNNGHGGNNASKNRNPSSRIPGGNVKSNGGYGSKDNGQVARNSGPATSFPTNSVPKSGYVEAGRSFNGGNGNGNRAQGSGSAHYTMSRSPGPIHNSPSAADNEQKMMMVGVMTPKQPNSFVATPVPVVPPLNVPTLPPMVHAIPSSGFSMVMPASSMDPCIVPVNICVSGMAMTSSPNLVNTMTISSMYNANGLAGVASPMSSVMNSIPLFR